MRAVEGEAEVRAQEAPAEREQVLLVAAARRRAHDAGFDLRGRRAVLVEPHVAQRGGFADRDLGGEVSERLGVRQRDEMLDQGHARAGAGLDDDARVVHARSRGARDVREVQRRPELAARGEADQDAAGGEGIRQQGVAVVGLVAGLAHQRDRGLGIALDQAREVGHLDPVGASRGQGRIEAAVHEHHPRRAVETKQARRHRGRLGPSRGLGLERVFPHASVVQILQVLVAAVGQPPLDEAAERLPATSRPGGAPGERRCAPRVGGRDAVEGRHCVHAAAVPGFSQS